MDEPSQIKKIKKKKLIFPRSTTDHKYARRMSGRYPNEINCQAYKSVAIGASFKLYSMFIPRLGVFPGGGGFEKKKKHFSNFG